MVDWVEVLAGEENQKYRRAGLVLKTIGWLLICWAVMITIWIWMGLRAGSNWWLWGCVGLFLGGALAVTIGNRLQSRAARLIRNPVDSDNGARAA
jgi:hypothetical protein